MCMWRVSVCVESEDVYVESEGVWRVRVCVESEGVCGE